MTIPWCQPLDDNEEIHITKEPHKEEYLRDEFEDDLHCSFKVAGVKAFNNHTESHMDDSNNNCDFHFKTVDKHKLVPTNSPNRINTKGIDTFRIDRFYIFICCTTNFDRLITGAKEIQIHTQKIIVNKPTVKGKETHHQHYVPQTRQKIK
jgi:hypothetical protein